MPLIRYLNNRADNHAQHLDWGGDTDVGRQRNTRRADGQAGQQPITIAIPEQYFTKVSFHGPVMMRGFFSEKRMGANVSVDEREPLVIYISPDDPNRVIIEGPLRIDSYSVDQGGQAGNFG